MTQAPLCPCGQPSPQAVICRACTARLKSSLEFAAAIAGDLDDAVAKLTRRGRGAARAGVRDGALPIDLAASEAAGQLRAVLAGWVRVIRDMPLRRDDPWPADTVAAMARWLLARLDAVRQHEAAADIHDEIADAVARAAKVVDRQPDRIGAGSCGLCGAQTWADGDSDSAVCERCEAVVFGVRERRRQLAAAADVLGTPREIAGALARLGYAVAESTISSWGTRGRIARRPGEREGQSVYALSDVLAMVQRAAN